MKPRMITAGTLKLSPEEAEKFAMAIAAYDFEQPTRFLRLCALMIIQHYEAGDQLAWPLRLGLANSIDNDSIMDDGKIKHKIMPEEPIDPSKAEKLSMQYLQFDEAEWLRSPKMVRYSGFHLASLYRLHEAGEIRSFLLKRDRNNVRGIRLWNRPSFDAYLKRQHEAAIAAGNPKGQVAWAKQK